MTNPFALHYTIKPVNPEAHLYRLTCKIIAPDPAGQIVYMPAWIPGSYMIRDFAKNIVQIRASDDKGEVQLEKRDKQTWHCAPCSGPLTLEYEVYAWDLSVRAAHLDTSHAYYNGSSVFLAVKGKEQQSSSIEILPPEGDQYSNWRVATTLPRNTAKLYGFGAYQAKDYEELIDHPVDMSDFSLASFEVGGIPHDIVITGKHRADMDRLSRDLQTICQTHIDMFRELPKMERYLFMTMVVGNGYGGLEHRSSCSLLCSRNDLPMAHQPELTDEYLSFLGLCSHEYFHTWNIKQIKPAVFMPYDLQQESYTRQLWAFEGITSYYDDLGLMRCGLIKADRYLELLGQMATRVWRGSGRLKQSTAESSFDAWTKFYKQDENAPNAIISYYSKGAMLALALDLLIQKHSNYERSLDDLMRHLWQQFGKPQIGVPEGEIETLASEIAGTDLSEFFSRYLYGTEDIPLADLLGDMGVHFVLRAAETMDDRGGKAAKTKQAVAGIGARFANQSSGALISNVFDDSPALLGGLSVGDIIIAIDQIKVDKANIDKVIASYPVGSNVTVHAFRRDELMEFSITLQVMEDNTCVITLKNDSTPEQLKRREDWLKCSHNQDQAQQTRIQIVN